MFTLSKLYFFLLGFVFCFVLILIARAEIKGKRIIFIRSCELFLMQITFLKPRGEDS